MPRTDIKLTSTDPSGKKVTTTITHVNNSASNATLRQFALQLNALTQNTYSAASKIVTTDLQESDG